MAVLLLGFDPRTVPGVDADLVETAMTLGQQRFDELGIDAVTCLFSPDDSAEARIVEALQQRADECVVIAGGVRKPEPLLALRWIRR